MNQIAFLELKYGNIYGGYPNYYAISEVAFLVYEPRTNKIFVESLQNTCDVDIINVYSRTDELGNTVEKVREVVNLRTGRKKPYDEEFKLGEQDLDEMFHRLRPTRGNIKKFMNFRCFRKYRVNQMIVFDGRRDIFLLSKTGANLRGLNILDVQKDITKETNYLFSMNKLAKVINFQITNNYLKSNNLEFWLHPIAQQQVSTVQSAAWDAARLMMVHEEFMQHHDDFMIKAALQLNRIEQAKAAKEASSADATTSEESDS